jgi:hypothetical protein
MIYSRKLKPDRDITGLLPAIFAIFVSGLAAITVGLVEGVRVLGAMFFIYSIFGFIAFYRTRNFGYSFSAMYMFFGGFYLNTVDVFDRSRKIFVQTPSSKIFLLLAIFVLIYLLYLLFTKRLKWRGREILELAAAEVYEGPDTYTDRPRPIVKLEYSRDEIENFAEYLRRNLIAIPYYEQERILFVPVKMGDEYSHLFSSNINYWNKTWVAFDFDGTISSHISKEDYLDFRKNLEFDHLCESLGKLFIEFFDYMRKKEEIRIIDKLNEVKIGVFS